MEFNPQAVTTPSHWLLVLPITR